MTNSQFFDHHTHNNSSGLSETGSKNVMSSHQMNQSFYIPQIDLNDKRMRPKWKPTHKMSSPNNQFGPAFAPYKLKDFK